MNTRLRHTVAVCALAPSGIEERGNDAMSNIVFGERNKAREAAQKK